MRALKQESLIRTSFHAKYIVVQKKKRLKSVPLFVAFLYYPTCGDAQNEGIRILKVYFHKNYDKQYTDFRAFLFLT